MTILRSAVRVLCLLPILSGTALAQPDRFERIGEWASQGQFKEAEPLLLAAHRARMPNRHANVYSAAALVKLYEAEGRLDEAARYRAPSSP